MIDEPKKDQEEMERDENEQGKKGGETSAEDVDLEADEDMDE